MTYEAATNHRRLPCFAGEGAGRRARRASAHFIRMPRPIALAVGMKASVATRRAAPISHTPFGRLRSPCCRATVTICVIAALISGPAFAAPLTPTSSQQSVDSSVRPGNDFYRYANGRWLNEVVLPDGVSRIDSTSLLRAENARRVRELIEDAATGGSVSGNRLDLGLRQKVGDYYASWIDLERLEAKGIAPLADELSAIAAIADRHALSAYLGHTLRSDDGTNTQTDGLFGAWIHQGFHDPDQYVPHLVQGGLGLPDRDDYLDANAVERRDLYRTHVAAVLRLAGIAQPEDRAVGILALETAIARTHASRTDTDNVSKTDNQWRRADFDAMAAGMDWGAYFNAAGLARQTDFVVWQPSAVIGAAGLVASQSIEAWRNYLSFHVIEHFTAVLPKAFRDEQLTFSGQMSGAQQFSDRAELAIAATNAALGEAVGRMYVAHYFPPEAKGAAVAMSENLRSAFRSRIARLNWMSPETREKALAKLAALKIGVGYPDTWTDYSSLAVVRGDAYGNLRRAESFLFRRDLAKLRQPVNPADWALIPQLVGGVINFSPNSMQFSAGILQPPYFDYTGDAASNYGSAGAGMAHEISHSFDELGSVYDARGRLGNWWTAEDLVRYRAATTPLVAQFDAYCPQTGLCVHGKQVLSESVADLVGLEVAFDAYHLSLNGRRDHLKNGLTGDQRFFLAFARRWRRQQSEPALRQQIETDSHAPGEFRSSTVRNMDAWYRTFDVKPGDKLYLRPEDRIYMR